MQKLRTEVVQLREVNDKNLTKINTSDLTLATEKAGKDKLNERLKQLELDNRALQDDLGFFEKLTQTDSSKGLAIRSLQAELLAGNQIKGQVLVIQPIKNAPDFSGKLEIVFSGLQNGKPWSMALPGGPQTIQLTQYKRVEGVFELPLGAVVKTVSAKLLEGNTTRAVQTTKI